MNSPTLNNRFLLPLGLLALAVASACSTTPATNNLLDEARSDYLGARDNPQAMALAPAELAQAREALDKADEAFTRHADRGDIDHLAYVAKQRVAIVQETTRRKVAEAAVTQAEGARDKLRLSARTDEADAAQRATALAQRQSDDALRRAAGAQRQADANRQVADSVQARNGQLEDQLKELNARKTDRGLVLTLGDMLFDTNQAQLKAGGLRSVERLGSFLKQNPQRKASIEGFTDSVGSESANEALSGRRADAVRAALVEMGVASDHVATHAYGEAHPVAGNDSADGRRANRRVEVILSDDAGVLTPR